MVSSATSDQIVFTIREVVREDLPRILELNHHLHEGEPILAPDPRIEEIWQKMVSDPRLHCFIAENGSQAVGSCILDLVPNLTRGARPFGVLQNVVAHHDYRGIGVGSELTEYALQFAWSQNCYQVLVQTGRPEVTAFYEKLGFRRDKIGLVAKPEWSRR